jgi:putative ABC transport system permease protein
MKDLRHAVRLLFKSPGFTILATLILALGIGANTAIFSVVNAVLLRSLPYDHPDRIVVLYETRQAEPAVEFPPSGPEFLDWRAAARSFDHISAADSSTYNLTGAGEPEQLDGERVSPGLLEALGVQPIIGRTFEGAEEQDGRHRVAILSYGLWQRRFGGDRAIVGRTISLDDGAYLVVGVMPDSFRFPAEKVDILVPLALVGNERTGRGWHHLNVFARFRPGVTAEQARAELASIGTALEQQHLDASRGHGVAMKPLRDELVGSIRPALLMLLSAVALVLLIACSNVANLLLARAAGRRKEMAVRLALGSSRARLIRQLLTESSVLAVLGGGAGLLLATWSVSFLESFFNRGGALASLPGAQHLGVDASVLFVTLGVSILTGVLFGLAPALSLSRADLNLTLKQSGGRGSTASGGRLRAILVASEVALAFVLLAGAGLLLRSFLRLESVDPGFRAQSLFSADLALPESRYPKGASVVFFDRLMERLAANPGVTGVAATNLLPLSGNSARTFITIEGHVPASPTERLRINPRVITPAYFSTMGIPLRRGRAFTSRDAAGSPPVTILNDVAARQFFGNQDPIGKRVKFRGDSWQEVVGVVASVKYVGLDQDELSEGYLPLAQSPSGAMTLVMRASADTATVSGEIRSAVREIDPNQPISQLRPMQNIVDNSVAPQRLNTFLIGVFAALALVLAMAGIYGVISYSVAERTSEIGLRMALGAGARDVLGMVLSESARLVAAGLAIGTAAALALTWLLRSYSFLFGIGPRDPGTLVSVAILLAGVAVVASLVPARRAMRVDPIEALRNE